VSTRDAGGRQRHVNVVGGSAVIAEMGERSRYVHGRIRVRRLLGVHAMLMPSVRTRGQARIDRLWAYFSKTRGLQVLDHLRAGRIEWSTAGESPTDAEPVKASQQGARRSEVVQR